MIITKHVQKRINEKLKALSYKDDLSFTQIFNEVRIGLMKAGVAKQIPVELTEDIVARMIILIAMSDALKVRSK